MTESTGLRGSSVKAIAIRGAVNTGESARVSDSRPLLTNWRALLSISATFVLALWLWTLLFPQPPERPSTATGVDFSRASRGVSEIDGTPSKLNLNSERAIDAPIVLPTGEVVGGQLDERNFTIAPGPSGNYGGREQQDDRQTKKIIWGLNGHSDGGVFVDAVSPGSVVGQLGLQQGDRILSINGKPIASPADFAGIYRKEGLPRQVEFIRAGRVFHSHP